MWIYFAILVALIAPLAHSERVPCTTPTAGSPQLVCGSLVFEFRFEAEDFTTTSDNGQFTYYFQPWNGVVRSHIIQTVTAPATPAVI